MDPCPVGWCHRAGVMLGAEDWGTLAPGSIPGAGEDMGGSWKRGAPHQHSSHRLRELGWSGVYWKALGALQWRAKGLREGLT